MTPTLGAVTFDRIALYRFRKATGKEQESHPCSLLGTVQLEASTVS
eukprot:COSAG02_NODE_35362_length_469_cov_1.118919_1_plen_45_part_10